MSVKNLLNEEFGNEVKELSKLKVGSDEYKVAVSGVTQIADRLIEIQKLENDGEEKARTRAKDEALKLRELESNERNEKIKNGIAIGTTLLSTVVLIWGTLGTWRFDTEHTPTSTQGRAWLNALLPKGLKR